jgi:uncharacterized protein (DUF433 family)
MLTHSRQLISCDRNVLGGTPVFAGTRVPIDSLVAHLKAGDSLATFLSDFPSVSREQVEAYLDLTAEAIAEANKDAGSA